MSIVAVHGPHTFGSRAVTESGAVMAVVVPTNGLQWDFKLDGPTTRPDQDFSWAFPPNGTPTPQALADPTLVTYATAGSKTATLTVTNVSRTVSNKALTNNVATLTTSATSGFKVGQWVTISGVGAPFDGTFQIASTPSGTTFTFAVVAANVTSAASGGTVTSATTALVASQYPPAGTYPITVTAVAGTAPLEMQQTVVGEGGGEEPPPEEPPPDEGVEIEVGYDPAAHTVTEVISYAEDNPDQLDEVLAAEEAGKGRVTLLTHLESMRP